MGTEPTQVNDVEQRLRQLLLLQETVKKVNSILDLEQLLDEIVGRVAETFGCTRTAVLLKDDVKDELEVTALRGFSNVHLKGHRYEIGEGSMAGHVGSTRRMRYAPDVRKDPFYLPVEESTLSEVAIPLISRSKFIGIFAAESASLDAFSREQIELLCVLADNIAIAVENAGLYKQQRLEKEKALCQLAEARLIQRALLPNEDPAIPGYAIDGVCLQLSAVGGDWYDYLHLADDLWGVALGDVCGKGVAAALLMAATRSLFRRAAEGTHSPSEVLTKLNDALLKDLPEGRFVTMAYLVLDISKGVMTFANAGHPYPLLMRAGAEPKSLETSSGFPLGMMPSRYSEIQIMLEPDDRVLLYSDGVGEASGPNGEEYGTSRLAQAVQSQTLSAKELLADVQEFTRGGILSDDATAIVGRRR